MLNMLKKLVTRYCFGELMHAFDRCFNLSSILQHVCVYLGKAYSDQHVQPVHLPVNHTWLHGLTTRACWTRRLRGLRSVWTTFPAKWDSWGQATELRFMDDFVGGWWGEWVLHDTISDVGWQCTGSLLRSLRFKESRCQGATEVPRWWKQESLIYLCDENVELWTSGKELGSTSRLSLWEWGDQKRILSYYLLIQVARVSGVGIHLADPEK